MIEKNLTTKRKRKKWNETILLLLLLFLNLRLCDVHLCVHFPCEFNDSFFLILKFSPNIHLIMWMRVHFKISSNLTAITNIVWQFVWNLKKKSNHHNCSNGTKVPAVNFLFIQNKKLDVTPKLTKLFMCVCEPSFHSIIIWQLLKAVIIILLLHVQLEKEQVFWSRKNAESVTWLPWWSIF